MNVNNWEPLAVYYYYRYVKGLPENESGKYLVVDFGGLTLDIALVDVQRANTQIQNTSKYVHSEKLGGATIDEYLYDYLKTKYIEERQAAGLTDSEILRINAGIDRAKNLPFYHKVEDFKVSMSRLFGEQGDAAQLSINYDVFPTFPIELVVSGQEFRELLEEYIRPRFIDAVKQAIHRLNPGESPWILLSGGTNKLPFVKDWLVTAIPGLLPQAIIAPDIDMQLVVSSGLAVMSYLDAGDNPITRKILSEAGSVTNIITNKIELHLTPNPMRRGTRALEEICCIFEAQTPLPQKVTKSIEFREIDKLNAVQFSFFEMPDENAYIDEVQSHILNPDRLRTIPAGLQSTNRMRVVVKAEADASVRAYLYVPEKDNWKDIGSVGFYPPVEATPGAEPGWGMDIGMSTSSIAKAEPLDL